MSFEDESKIDQTTRNLSYLVKRVHEIPEYKSGMSKKMNLIERE